MPDEVKNIISKSNTHKSTCVDGVRPTIIKHFGEFIATANMYFQ